MDQLAGLTEEARKLALERFRLLQPHLEDDRPLKAVGAAAGIPFRTAQRWVSLYWQFGLTALARKKRTDSRQHRNTSAKLKEAIEGIALQKPPIPVAAICRQSRRLAQDLGEEPPSYWLVYRIVAALPADLVTLAHEGTKAYSNAFELVYRREAGGPNAIWQADHTPLDILLIRPDGAAAKPWLTTVIDDHSRAVAGYFLSFEDPCALHTSLALRQAIWCKEDSRWIVCGIPDVLYTDNGSDFTSQHLEQVGADLKIRLVFSIPGKPRGRGRIERFFSTVNEMFLCELDGYAPAGGVVRGKPALTLTEFDIRFRTSSWTCTTAAKMRRQRCHPSNAGKSMASCRGCRTRWSNWTYSCSRWRRHARSGLMEFTSKASATSQQRWRHTLVKRSPYGLIQGTWQKSASSTTTSFCAAPSVLNLRVRPSRSVIFSAPETGDGGNYVASFEIVKPP